MAFSDVRRAKGDAAGAAGVGTLTAFIDQGSEFSGKLSFKDTVRIDGRFEGEIKSENTLIIGETGLIEAKITSQTVVVSGEVNGDVEAGTLLHLHKTARFMGNVKTRNLVIEEGASFNGHVDMGDSLAQARPGADKPDTSKPDASKGDGPKGDVHQTKKHEPKNA